jgi:hypothetical protein
MIENEDLIILLKEDIFYRAKLFINNIGEFAPFASELIDNEVKPIVIYDDSDKIIKGEKLINILKEKLSININEKASQACAIAYDVYISNLNNDGETVKTNALCLIISDDGINWEEDYYPYKIINKECVWG